MKPLLAHVYEPHRITYPCYVQPKLNGIRALYQNGYFQSRDQLPFPKGLLAHLSNSLRTIFGPEVILDGELYVHGWPLQRINAAVTPVRQQPTEDTKLVTYNVFDVVDFTKTFEDRFSIAEKRLSYDERNLVFLVDTRRGMGTEHTDACYKAFVDDGYEGMMYRLGDCPYTVLKQTEWKNEDGFSFTTQGAVRNGGMARTRFLSDKDNRCWHLLKRKDWQDDEFEWEFLDEGDGKLKGTLGSFCCKTKSGRAFSVGSGLTDAERSHYWANPPIGRLVKVKYLVLSSDGIPLNPTILAIL